MQTPRIIDAPWGGLAVNGGASALNAACSLFLIRNGRRRRSPALVADEHHLLADVKASAGVGLTDLSILDPILAATVALDILWTGWRLTRETVGGLLDEAVPPEKLARLRRVIAANAEGATEAHERRTRHAGRMTFVEFHLVVDGAMSVTEAHDICDALERAIKDEVEGALISIHIEPGHKTKHSGIVVM